MKLQNVQVNLEHFQNRIAQRRHEHSVLRYPVEDHSLKGFTTYVLIPRNLIVLFNRDIYINNLQAPRINAAVPV
jgi:hypothetical protein